MKRILSALAGAALLAAGLWSTPALAVANVAATKHNLSSTGPGTIKATAAAETQTCVFCHIPHAASTAGPLWNRSSPATPGYTQYTSSTIKGTMGQPNGSSLLCLSCHDGTIALGDLLSRTARIAIAGTNATGQLTTGGQVGTYTTSRDLSDDHPVSFTYNAALASGSALAGVNQLATPVASTSAKDYYVGPQANHVRLDGASQMQCSSCHDPHDNTNGKMLVMNNTGSALCVTCHTKTGWSASSHSTSTATWNGTGTNPWLHSGSVTNATTGVTSGAANVTTVTSQACENCHQPHTAGGKARLMNYGTTDEANCFTCHTGTVAGKTAPAKNMQTETTKLSAHAVASFNTLHDPTEANVLLSASRHVECADCHNPHQTNATAGTTQTASGAPTLPGSLLGVKGVDIGGAAVAVSSFEYEVCFRCHGDSTGKMAPARTRAVLATTTGENNVRKEFLTTNASFHPVAGVGKNTTVPSLISPLTANSRITCTACHNNNAGPGAGGTGPKGPHGSTITPLLERAYTVSTSATKITESAAAYALCYKCHNRTLIIGNGANSFPEHNKHIVSEGTSCSVCHDPHGVSTNARLINFDTTIVTGARTFTKNGAGGSCNLTCHGANHNPWTY